MRTRDLRSLDVLLNLLPAELEPQVAADVVSILGAKGRSVLVPVWAGQGYPADVQRVLGAEGGFARSEVPVFLAQRFSPGARELLNDARVSWADAGGAGVIRVPPGVFISREEPAAFDTLRRTERGVRWTPLASDIAEVVLHECSLTGAAGSEELVLPQIRNVAELVGASQSAVGKVLAQFDAVGATEKRGGRRGPTAHRVLRRPGELLSEWAGYYTSRLIHVETRYHVPWRDPEASLVLLERAAGEVPVVASGGFASDFLAPYLTGVSSLLAYVDRSQFAGVRERFAQNQDVSEVESGERVRVRVGQPHLSPLSVLTESGHRVAPPVRVYADLLSGGPREAEAAEVMRRDLIGW